MTPHPLEFWAHPPSLARLPFIVFAAFVLVIVVALVLRGVGDGD